MRLENEESNSEALKAQVRRQWNEAATAYHRWIPFMREQYAPASELMLELARLGPGSCVLDIAAGDGDQSLMAAERVGHSGRVLATDLAEQQLGFVAASAREAGLDQLETSVMDAENLGLPDSTFNAVICRFAMGLFADPDRAVREMRRVLKQGGRVSLATGADGGSPQWSLVAPAIRTRLGDRVPDSFTGPYLGTREELEEMFEAAGFHELETYEVSVPLYLSSLAEARGYLWEWYPAVREAVSLLSPDECEQAWQEIAQALADFRSGDGFEIPNEVLVAAGSVP